MLYMQTRPGYYVEVFSINSKVRIRTDVSILWPKSMTKLFIEQAEIKNSCKNRWDYSKVKLKDEIDTLSPTYFFEKNYPSRSIRDLSQRLKVSKQKVIITCKKHGPFEQEVSSHLQGKYGCKNCEKLDIM